MKLFKGLENLMPSWKKVLYIVKPSSEITVDENGIPHKTLGEKVEYRMNYQHLSGFLEVTSFGLNARYIQKAISHNLDIFEKDLIQEGDLACLDGSTTPNYTVIGVKPQQEVVAIYFQLTSSLSNE